MTPRSDRRSTGTRARARPTIPHRAIHHVIRYTPALRESSTLRRDAPILEIGSGASGIGTWERRPFFAVDLDFPAGAVPHLRPAAASAASLPFPDRSFELVLMIDVLESVPERLRPRALAEAARVTRGVLLVTNVCGPAGADADLGNAAWCQAARVPTPEWLVRQVGAPFPTVGSIRDELARHGHLSYGPNMSVAWNRRIFRLEQRLRQLHVVGLLQPVLRWWGRLAPFQLPGKPPTYRWWFRLERNDRSATRAFQR